MPIEVPGGTETILLVLDDDETSRRFFARIVRSLGYKVLVATSGTGALELLRGSREQIDLVVIWMEIADLNGSQLVQRLGDVRPGIKARYMSSWVSGHPDEARTYHGVRVPESLLVTKPFTRQDLARQLRKALEEE